jgi:DNA-binding NtrC family response regulator/tetratricopeptide (TPR) repeat protein
MTYDDALKQLRRGHFRELIDSFNEQIKLRDGDLRSRILLGYVLALTGRTSSASSTLAFDVSKVPTPLRCQVEAGLGIISWRSGDHDSAWTHLRRAVQQSYESRDVEWIAQMHLHLFRFAVDSRPSEALGVILPGTRKAVTRAGRPSLTAYLHNCVATFEGYRGHLDEASRHCALADSLLETDPNAWIGCGILINRGCIAILRCEFREASRYFRAAMEGAEICGSTHMHAIAQSNSAWVDLLTGQFRKAEETLRTTLSNSSKIGTSISALDLLARVYLAQGELDKCEEILGPVMSGHPVKYSTYETRWAALTRAKLLYRQGELDAALNSLNAITSAPDEINDGFFAAACHLTTAYILGRADNAAECARELVRAGALGAMQNRELQGQFNYLIGHLISANSPGFGSNLRDRGKRIWASQGVVSLSLELGASTEVKAAHDSNAFRSRRDDSLRAALNGVAAFFDVAYSPRLIAAELVNVLSSLGGAIRPDITESSGPVPAAIGTSAINFPVGQLSNGRALIVTCGVPTNPGDAVILSDVFRLARAALHAEEVRQTERTRAAIWPAEAVEDQAGALFTAEEMVGVLDTARRVARVNIPVLITGETGTGKEVLARLIHSYSPRSAKTFLPFNCSATPRDMLDAQLFGHRRGAFTGATENFQGVIRAAAGGTLFLDEIGESTLDIQPKLLRFLESGEVHPIGETHPQRVDVRIIAATNADVDALVAQGRFREDLYYRLNIVRLPIPPLRERRVEIPVFANHYLQKYAQEMDKGELRLAEETMEYLVLYRWPGNVRQIANEMRRLAALAERGAVLMPEHLSSDIAASRRTLPAAERTLDASEIVVRIDQSLSAATQHVEQTMIKAAIEKTNSVDEAAKLLGLSRKGLYLKRLRFGMTIDRTKDDAEAPLKRDYTTAS